MTLGDNTDIILFFVQFSYYLETLLVFCVIRFFFSAGWVTFWAFIPKCSLLEYVEVD